MIREMNRLGKGCSFEALRARILFTRVHTAWQRGRASEGAVARDSVETRQERRH